MFLILLMHGANMKIFILYLFVYLRHTLIFRSVIPLVPKIHLKVLVSLQFICLIGKAMGWRNGESMFRRNRCLHLYGSTMKI